MKCKIGGQTVDLEIEGRVGSGVDVTRFARLGSKEASRTQPPTVSSNRMTRPLAGLNPASLPPSFTFTLSGQIRGGKNNMKVGRNGKHYPDKTFAKWRDEAVIALYQQRAKFMPFVSQMHDILFKKPTILEIEVHYAAGDLRRRDIPGMLDALFHVLERAQVVEDDAQIKESHWYELPVDKTNPHVKVTVKERKP